MAKNGQVHEDRKVGRSKATPTKLFFVDSYDLKSMSFKFGNDIFMTFEMPIGKINISLLFCPSVVRSPWSILKLFPVEQKIDKFMGKFWLQINSWQTWKMENYHLEISRYFAKATTE